MLAVTFTMIVIPSIFNNYYFQFVITLQHTLRYTGQVKTKYHVPTLSTLFQLKKLGPQSQCSGAK